MKMKGWTTLRLTACSGRRAGDIVAAGVKGGLNILFADITNSLTTATYRQRISRFTEALDFVSKADRIGRWGAEY